MRSTLRGLTASAVTVGLVTSTVVLAAPVLATDPPVPPPAKSTLTVAVTHTPNLGLTCVVGVSLRTASGQVGGKSVLVQKRVAGTTTWTNYARVKTSATSLVKVRLKTIPAVSFRAKFSGTATVAADNSNTVTCKPKALKLGTGTALVTPLQKKLKALRIRPASTSKRFDYNTLEAVYAFQKANGMKRTGVVTAYVYNRIMKAKSIKTPSWCADSTTMCVDISQQVGYLKVKGKRYVIPVSSGGGYYFYNPQSHLRELAKTPRGMFHVYFKKPGATTGPLGTYYWISFFSGGYGIHGSASVPTYPASHGCVREPRTIEQWVYRHLPIGAGVHVHK